MHKQDKTYIYYKNPGFRFFAIFMFLIGSFFLYSEYESKKDYLPNTGIIYDKEYEYFFYREYYFEYEVNGKIYNHSIYQSTQLSNSYRTSKSSKYISKGERVYFFYKKDDPSIIKDVELSLTNFLGVYLSIIFSYIPFYFAYLHPRKK